MSADQTPGRPLEGLRVVAVSQYGAGPFATLHLADLGADVIKIEDPAAGGDMGRYVPPYTDEQDSLFFQALNRGKRSLALDLRSPEGASVLGDLVAVSDALFCNLRGDGPARLGLTYEQLRHRNPRIVCCSLSGYGTSGSRASEPAFDYLIQAELGYMALTGEPGAPPTRSGVSVVDWAAGYAAAFALLAGVQQAQRTGRGADIDLSLYEIGLGMLNYVASWHLTRGYQPERLPGSAHPSLVPSQVFATADGHLFVMCNKESFYGALCEVIERPDLAADPRFANAAARLEHRETLVELLAEVFVQRSTADWMAALRGTVPVAVPRELPEALADDFLRERGDIVEIEHERFGVLRQIATPFRFAGDEPQYRRAAALGEDSDEVLSSVLGYDAARIAALREGGVVSGPERTPARMTATPASDEGRELLVANLRDWVRRRVLPVASEYELRDEYPAELVQDMRDFGLFGAVLDPANGGAGLDYETYVAAVEEVSRGWMTLAGVFNSHLILAHIVERFGTDDQRARFLPGLASGEAQGALALTEPGAGSDVQAIATTARRDGDVYVLNGQKHFITNGRRARYVAVLAKTDPAAQPAHRGMALFVVERGTPGFSVGRDFQKLGYRGIETSELFFEDCAVPADNLVGGEGRGFQQVMAGLELGRLNVAARGVGLARAAYEDALAYAQQRHSFGVPIAEHQAIQIKLADMSVAIEAARLLTQRAARLKDAGQRVDLEAGQAKLFATEAAQMCALEGMRIHGGAGYMQDLPVERYLRDAPLLIVGEGTNEVQRLVIARRLLEQARGEG